MNLPLSLSYAVEARNRAASRARFRREQRQARALEAEKLLRLYSRAHNYSEWDQARTIGRMLGAPDPGVWSRRFKLWTAIGEVVNWAQKQGVKL